MKGLDCPTNLVGSSEGTLRLLYLMAKLLERKFASLQVLAVLLVEDVDEMLPYSFSPQHFLTLSPRTFPHILLMLPDNRTITAKALQSVQPLPIRRRYLVHFHPPRRP